MKKMIFAFAVLAASATAVIGLSSFSTTESADVEVVGYGDGHCTKCGLNTQGNYICPCFNPTSKHPSECKCGHKKSSHASN